jgi:hypothetical protein
MNTKQRVSAQRGGHLAVLAFNESAAIEFRCRGTPRDGRSRPTTSVSGKCRFIWPAISRARSDGWLDEIGMTSHNNYDVAVLLQLGCLHMRADQRRRAREELARLVDWCLAEAIAPGSEIVAVRALVNDEFRKPGQYGTGRRRV